MTEPIGWQYWYARKKSFTQPSMKSVIHMSLCGHIFFSGVGDALLQHRKMRLPRMPHLPLAIFHAKMRLLINVSKRFIHGWELLVKKMRILSGLITFIPSAYCSSLEAKN